MQSKSFKLNILSLEKELYTGEAVSLNINAEDGELTVLSGHAPIMAVIKKGPIRAKKADGTELKIHADRGLLKVFHDQASVMI